MSSPNPREHDRSDKDYGTLPSKMKSSPKASALSKLKGLMETRHFGAKRRDRHKMMQKAADYKKKNPGEKYIPF